ncbi:Stk1 family PASTA domain-containing Ser/Thr kinase [Streptomyces sp. NBS 14/10]|uniref:Stk1 family PASTA domain-containing Ser/Thr kinase n=1 Tax=Streptomyces sp. NBS 14/10 TaxID=1945643 RepID=UPI000B8022F0|nr:Stk1 family PASTA domain-containing Ser/Thr kinase [Streptomyces sp. NBS 14/10]KAK1180741.1 Stk1 family PASTA domain-containing Ser/Thr kinase [Streptomyces sp. NBS 14/10]NUS90257.1 Stk1 family PASTA domain-containing Ser/Thr kinase [Streptomyces sp.]
MEEPRRLGGRYELGSVLGRGGMAEVYLAHDTRLGRTVAVKTLRVDLARDPSFQARFRREAQSAASLNHPAIVAVYDTGEDYVDGVSIPYIVMEYVDGSTLRELLHSGRKLLPERTLEMTVGILQALEYSHRNGIVHRDIKPANVMLTRNGQVKVMDFGIARAMGDAGMTMTQTAAVIGTAQYLSPEQAKGETVDARSDLYSTGCLLYELLTVRPPFIGDSPVAVAYQHVREEPQPPSTFDPEITPEMDAIVLRALVKDPDYRYQSADEMRADIEAALEGQPVAATAALGAVGYGGEDQPTTMLRSQDVGAQTSMLPPMRDDDGGFGYDERPDRRRGPEKKSNLSTILLVLAGILVLVGAIFIGKEIFSGGKNSDNVDVPSLKGLTLSEARQQGENSDFKVKATGSPIFCDADKNTVCKQSVEGEKAIERYGTVQLTMSKGPKPAAKVEVPDVINIQFESAKQQLEAKGFKVNKTTEESDQTTDKVIDQDPKGGKKVAPGTEITLTVARAQAKVTVPDVTTKKLADATSTLESAGLKVQSTEVENADVEAGTVISQNPQPNEQVLPNTTVTLTVAKAPAQQQNVAVPQLRGQKLKDAKKALEDAGLTVGTVSGSQNEDSRVLFSDPAEGQQVPKGQVVNLTTFDSGQGNNGGGDGGGDGGTIPFGGPTGGP